MGLLANFFSIWKSVAACIVGLVNFFLDNFLDKFYANFVFGFMFGFFIVFKHYMENKIGPLLQTVATSFWMGYSKVVVYSCTCSAFWFLKMLIAVLVVFINILHMVFVVIVVNVSTVKKLKIGYVFPILVFSSNINTTNATDSIKKFFNDHLTTITTTFIFILQFCPSLLY
uniref:Uncharacterized protein n=1 Tax=Meloidogyne enterolobii TaxID=390850 RepID=A0A6V7TPU5_MELEN|nr:unnamed protein product [Meloidogyne enterolobii]